MNSGSVLECSDYGAESYLICLTDMGSDTEPG